VLPLRVLKAIYYGTVINCVVMAMVLVAAVRIAEVFLPWHAGCRRAVYDRSTRGHRHVHRPRHRCRRRRPGSIRLATTNNLHQHPGDPRVHALYSTTGGLRSVVATDVAQFALAMVGHGGLRLDRDPDGRGAWTRWAAASASCTAPTEPAHMLSFAPPRREH
jgi:solute:Na+ symporter, SSS family